MTFCLLRCSMLEVQPAVLFLFVRKLNLFALKVLLEDLSLFVLRLLLSWGVIWLRYKTFRDDQSFQRLFLPLAVLFQLLTWDADVLYGHSLLGLVLSKSNLISNLCDSFNSWCIVLSIDRVENITWVAFLYEVSIWRDEDIYVGSWKGVLLLKANPLDLACLSFCIHGNDEACKPFALGHEVGFAYFVEVLVSQLTGWELFGCLDFWGLDSKYFRFILFDKLLYLINELFIFGYFHEVVFFVCN